MCVLVPGRTAGYSSEDPPRMLLIGSFYGIPSWWFKADEVRNTLFSVYTLDAKIVKEGF